jgi:predicted nucleotidyltransferase
MSEEMEKEIKKITDKIVREYQPEKIILFGSYAWGNPTKDSDVDLFIVKETENTREMSRKINRLFFPRYVAMDFMIYTPKQFEEEILLEEPFIKKIIQSGNVLYEKKNERG